MKISDARIRGAAIGGARIIGHDAAVRAGDDLVQLSDAFGAGIVRGWTTFNGGVLGTNAISGSELVLEPTAGSVGGAFWYNTNQGPLVFRTLSGDFRSILDGFCRNSADSGTPPVTFYRIAGQAIHDPARGVDLDYDHVGFGSTADVDLRVEHKSTIASVSDPLGGSSPGFSSVSNPSGSGQLLLEQVGDRFTMRVRSGPAGAWTTVREYTRASPLPRGPLQLGMMVYSSEVVHDIELHVRSISVSRA